VKRKTDSAERAASVYLVAARGSGLIRIGVASDPGQRLRELQVGSPLKLELAHIHACPDRLAAEAILEELERRFAGRRAHGHWFWLDAVDVRSALANPATLGAPEAAAAARALAAAESARREAAFRRRRGRGSRARTEKELAYQRRRQRERAAKQRQAARLLARGWTQDEAAAAVAVTPRTLRNWKQAPTFSLARAASAPPAPRRPRRRRQPTPEQRPVQPQPDPAAGGPRELEQPDSAAASLTQIEARRLDSYANWLDSNQARRGKLTRAEIRAREREREQK
jgi:Meiotically Up-regulated Gene 113 (MUG113) protein